MAENRSCAPTAVFVYNRKDHTKKTLYALRDNFLAEQTELYIFSDGAKNERDRQAVEEVRNFVGDFAAQDGFRSIRVSLADRNYGPDRSIISGVTRLFEKSDRVIVVEDDILTSRDYLTYMNDALDFYAADPRIWSVSGYTPPLKGLKTWKPDVYFFYRACSWGWATWKDRWERADWEMRDYDRFVKNPALVSKLARGGSDMPGMLMRQMEAWDIRWCYAQSMADMLTVYPRISRVRNIGNDGSGTHTSALSGEFDTRLNECYDPCVFRKPEIHDGLARQFRLLFDISVWGKLNRRYQRLKNRLKVKDAAAPG